MAKKYTSYTRWAGGISDFIREGLITDSYAFGRSIDVRSDPQNLSILPRTIKESGSTIIDLPKWADTIPSSLDTYIYGNLGNIYKRTFAGSYSKLTAVPNSHGNGLTYFAGDDYVYFTSDSTIGRYGPVSSASPTFSYDFLAAQGGVPLNTNSLQLLSASSQYASRADTASLSDTSDLAIEAQIKPSTLPSVGNSMTLVSKWDESAALRSYKFDLYAVSGVFGDGSNGAITVSSNSTYDSGFSTPLIDSACTGTIATSILSATNASFASGQKILIHQSQGTGSGTNQFNTIQGYTAGTITLETPLNADYVTGAQVIVLRQFTDFTVNVGVTLTAKAWNGSTGGLIAFLASGTVTVNGVISANTCGFRGGVDTSALNAGGTGGTASSNNQAGGGGGGGNGTTGQAGQDGNGPGTPFAGSAGASSGTTDLTTITFGGPGGTGGTNVNGNPDTVGGNGGGIIFLTAASLTVAGFVTSNGGSVANNANANTGGSGGGAGGSILFRTQTGSIGTGLVVAAKGTAATSNSGGGVLGGDGAVGRIHLDYLTSLTGTTTNPILTSTQDNNLVTTTTYQLRLAISDNGTDFDTLTKNIGISTNLWQQVGVSWTASTSTAEFFLNAISQGTAIGTRTIISDNTSRFAVGTDFNAATVPQNFYNGLIDEVRVYNMTRTADDFLSGLNQQIPVNAPGLIAYYKFNNDYTDATANTNLLTPSGSPSFSGDVPFASPTTRQDIDQSATTAGNTYTVPTTISEASSDKLVFTPSKDPQKSIAVKIAATGTGDWTLTVHDSNNILIAAKTITNANLHTGLFEFVFDTPWSPLTNFTNNYHFHLTSTVADGTVTTQNAGDLSTVTFTTYYSFLMTDSDFHPLARFLNFWVVGNGRHIGKYDATLYDPNFITLPAGYRVRCFGFWQGYLMIGTWRGTSITDFDEGEVFIWDGVAPTFTDHFTVPEGGINALLGANGVLNVWAGYQGKQFIWQGYGPVMPIKRIPKASDDTFIEIFPQAVTMWRSLLRYGAAANSDSTQVQKGVYTWGQTNTLYPQILTYDYPISTGTLTGPNLKIGLLTTVGGKLLIGWQDNVSFGIDYVAGSNPVYPTARVEFLIEDDDAVWRQKQAVNFTAVFAPLLDGQSITLQHRLDDTTNWITNPDLTSTSDTDSRMAIIAGRYNQAQVGIDLATSVATGPIINGAVLETEDQSSSGRLGSG